jgi:hypothetical protein
MSTLLTRSDREVISFLISSLSGMVVAVLVGRL